MSVDPHPAKAFHNDSICIVADTPERGEAIRRAIRLRGFDEITCLSPSQALLSLDGNSPALVIVDVTGAPTSLDERLRGLFAQFPPGTASLVLADGFDEEFFLSCHDAGARDFLVKPVADTYLLSRILLALEQGRLYDLLAQRDRILKDLSAIAEHSGVFTTHYFLRLLQEEAERSLFVPNNAPDSQLSLLILQLEGYKTPLREETRQTLYRAVGKQINTSSRGFDVVGEYFLDKFAVMLPQTSLAGAQALAERVRQNLEGLVIDAPGGPFTLKTRIGLADFHGCRHYEDLLNKALEALKTATPVS